MLPYWNAYIMKLLRGETSYWADFQLYRNNTISVAQPSVITVLHSLKISYGNVKP